MAKLLIEVDDHLLSQRSVLALICHWTQFLLEEPDVDLFSTNTPDGLHGDLSITRVKD